MKDHADAVKSSEGCHFCGEGEVAALQFHHIDPQEKLFGISDAWKGGWSMADFVAEIAKCITICANCHAKLHAGVIQYEGEPPCRA